MLNKFANFKTSSFTKELAYVMRKRSFVVSVPSDYLFIMFQEVLYFLVFSSIFCKLLNLQNLTEE
jgi:hypothetical protein